MEIRTSDGVELSFDIAGTDSPSFFSFRVVGLIAHI